MTLLHRDAGGLYLILDRNLCIWICFSWDSCQVSSLWHLWAESVTYWQTLSPSSAAHMILSRACLCLVTAAYFRLLACVAIPPVWLDRINIPNCGSLVSFSHIPPKQSSPQHTGQILLEVRGCCLFTPPSLFLRGIIILLASPVMPCYYVSLNSCHTAPARRDHLSFYSRRDNRELCK